MWDVGWNDELLIHPSHFILHPWICCTAYINLRFSLHPSGNLLSTGAGPEASLQESLLPWTNPPFWFPYFAAKQFRESDSERWFQSAAVSWKYASGLVLRSRVLVRSPRAVHVAAPLPVVHPLQQSRPVCPNRSRSESDASITERGRARRKRFQQRWQWNARESDAYSNDAMISERGARSFLQTLSTLIKLSMPMRWGLVFGLWSLVLDLWNSWCDHWVGLRWETNYKDQRPKTKGHFFQTLTPVNFTR